MQFHSFVEEEVYMSILNPLRVSAMATALVLLSAQTLIGQQPTEEAYAVVDRRHDQVMSHSQNLTPAELQELVGKHGDVSEMRMSTDPRAVECRRLQANLLYIVGRYDDARKELARAAVIAMENEDVGGVAFAYLDAAAIAVEQGQAAEAAQLALQAHRLSQISGMNANDRRVVQRRLSSSYRG
jgi:hypothetical protein